MVGANGSGREGSAAVINISRRLNSAALGTRRSRLYARAWSIRIARAWLQGWIQLRDWREAKRGNGRGIPARNQMMHHGAQSVEIAARFDLATVLLGRRIAMCPDH